MNRKQLYESMGEIDETVLERSEQNKRAAPKRRLPRWAGLLAAVLAVVVVGVAVLMPGSGPLASVAYAIETAQYPETPPYPNETAADFEAQYDAWWSAQRARREAAENYDPEDLSGFFRASIPQFLSGAEGQNKAYSPLNVYFALGMLAELTGGESRQQILDLVGANSVEELRSQAKAVWNAQYQNDGATTTILASSLWLNEEVSFVPETMNLLAENYYASSYQGEMGSAEFNRALQSWLNEQTGGLLKEQAGEIELEADTILALATTVYYRAKWGAGFSESRTEEGVFHSPQGDVTAEFMHSRSTTNYYWGENFSAVGKSLENSGSMWFLLPDEGVSPEELLRDGQAMDFLLSPGEWENSKYLFVNLALPKFDITSQTDLREGLAALGVTDVMDPESSDFTPMTTEAEGIFLSQAQHDVRVAIDEEGVTAAAYTVMAAAGAGEPPEEEVDFVLDRPFLFVLTSSDGLPLFVGVVNQPNG